MTEQWAKVPECPAYEISTAGRVMRGNRELKPAYVRGIYPKITASEHGKSKNIYLADAVWGAFMGPLDDGAKIKWRDGNPRNPRLENLVCITSDRRREVQAWMLTPDNVRKRVAIDLSVNHGRFKKCAVCTKGHALSMTGQPDGNTRIFLYGNRACLACERGEPRRLYPYSEYQ